MYLFGSILSSGPPGLLCVKEEVISLQSMKRGLQEQVTGQHWAVSGSVS